MIFTSKEPAMRPTLPSKKKIFIYIFLFSLGWLFLWLFPWQAWLSTLIWLKVGISLTIFILPGAFTYLLLSKGYQEWWNTVTFGFVISHFLIAVLGTIGRFAHIPFNVVKHSFLFLGFILSLLYLILSLYHEHELVRSCFSFRQILMGWPLIIILALSIGMSIQRVITSDDLTYLTLLTKFQHSTSLDFNDIFLGSANTISTRFWILSAPFSQAFLADFSQLHGVFLLGGFYEPFLTVLSIASLYSLARYLNLSKRAAIAAISFQIVFLALLSNYLSPGSPFFAQLSADKATASFIISPIFIISAIHLLEHSNFKNFILCLIIGLSLSLMHAVSLAFTLVIVGFIGLFRFTPSTFKRFWPLLAIILIILTPQILVRFAEPDIQGTVAYAINNASSSRGNEALFRVLGNTIFYGFNPSILAMIVPYESLNPILEAIVKWGWTLIPLLSAVFAIRQSRQKKIAQFVCAGFFLVVIAGIPFTGWILGYFVSPRMLARTTWLYPYGIGTVYLLISVRDETYFGGEMYKWIHKIEKNIKLTSLDLPLTLIAICSTAILLLIMQYYKLPNLDLLSVNRQRYEEFAHIGQFLDNHIKDQAIMIGSRNVNDLIPGLAGKAYVVNFRDSKPLYAYFYTQKEREDRYNNQQKIFSNEITPEKRLKLINQYDIEYILIKKGEFYLLKNLVLIYPSKFNQIEIDRYFIFEVQ
jgi:hypothetical protein